MAFLFLFFCFFLTNLKKTKGQRFTFQDIHLLRVAVNQEQQVSENFRI